MDRDLVEGFASFFRGRVDAWGSVWGESNKEPVTLTHYERHLKGEVSLGIYPLLDDGTCYFCAIDLDEKNFDKARAIRQEFFNNSIPAYIAESKSKGYHIFSFASEKFVAKDIRRIAHHILTTTGIKAEVFPKQDAVSETTPLGNYINLPCFGHTRSFLTSDLKEVPLEVALERIKVVPQEAIDRMLPTLPKGNPQEELVAIRPRKATGKLPCFEKMMAGVPEGCRDEVTFRLAIHLHRQGMPPQLAEAALLEWDAKYNQPAIGSITIRQKIKQAYSGKYGLGCLNDLIQSFCERDCPIYRKRHTEIDHRKMVGGREIDIMGLSRLGTHPASFGLTIDGSTLELNPSDLLSLKRVKAKAIETLPYVPFPGMKPTEWEILVNSLLAEVVDEEAPKDASIQARYVECIYDWVETTPGAERPEDIEAGRPIKREDGFFFRMKDAINYLAKHHRLNVEPGELYRVVKAAGGGTKTIRLGKLFKLWSLPLRKDEEGEES